MSDILDNNPNYNLADDKPFFPIALRWGLIGAAISVIYYLIAQLMGFAIPTSTLGMVLQFVVGFGITIFIAYSAIKAYRQELGGYIVFGRALLVAFVALIISVVISNLFTYIYVAFIDPDSIEKSLEAMQEMFAKFGMSEDQIEQAIEQQKGNMTPYKMLLNGIMGGAFFSIAIGAITAAVMKKQPPASL